MKPLLVLRPEPGNQATVERARAMGLAPLSQPLFTVEPVAWAPPDTSRFDFVLLTSANALRHGGKGLASLVELPALAVGSATAAAARDAGFQVALVGDQGVDALLRALPGTRRLLHLAGADHHRSAAPHRVETILVYRSVAAPLAAISVRDAVALVHSPRAGARLAELATCRSTIVIAAISPAAAAACGDGWARIEAADQPSERALLALAARLCQD